MPLIKGQSGIDWNYDIEGEGENLLFVHGWGVDKRIWRQQSKHFSQFYKVITIDLPGHGKSSWEKISFEDIAKDLGKILVEIVPGKIIVVGSSMGGLLALKVYEGIPEKITKLIFVGSTPKFAKSADFPFGVDVAQIRKLADQLDLAYPQMVDVFFRSLFTKYERQTRRYKWLQKFRQTDEKPLKPALMQYLDILEQVDLRELLKRVELPILFVNGTEDAICTNQAMAYLQKLKPNAHYDFFDQCGHFPFLSKPHEFNKILENFLQL